MTTQKIGATMSVSGRYKLIRRKAADESVVQETAWCKNILTLYYFNQAMTTTGIQPLGCVVGTGNTTPAESDTSLDTFLAGTDTKQTQGAWTKNTTVSPRSTTLSITYRFGEGVAAGNVAEVGMTIATSPNSGTPIISRALVVDSGGSPTTITVLSDEYLDVVWDVTFYVPEDDTGSFNMDIDGASTSFDYTVRAIDMNSIRWGANVSNRNYIGAYFPSVNGNFGSHSVGRDCAASAVDTLVAYDSAMTGNGSTNRATSVAADSYTADSKQRAYTVGWGLNVANISINSIYISLAGSSDVGLGLGAFQVLLDPPVTKVSTKVFSFDFVLSLANAS